MLDAENLAEGVEDKKKNPVKTRTIGEICRESFRLPVHRQSDGWVVIFDADRIEIGKLRFGLNREEEAKEAEGGQAVKGAASGQLGFDGPAAAEFDAESGEWNL